MRLIIKLTLCACAFMISSNHADPLYTGYIVKESDKLTTDHIRQALAQVLVKVSGYAQINQSKHIEKIKKTQLNTYILSKSYRQIGSTEQDYWIIRFEKNKVDGLLKAKKSLIWGQPRPKIYLVLINKNHLGWEIVDQKNIPQAVSDTLFLLRISRGIQFNYVGKQEVISLVEKAQQREGIVDNYAGNGLSFADIHALLTHHYEAEYVIFLTSQELVESTTATNNQHQATTSSYDESHDEEGQLIEYRDNDDISTSPHSLPHNDALKLQWRFLEYQLYHKLQMINIHFGNQPGDAKELSYQSLNDIIDFIHARETQANDSNSVHRLVLHNIHSITIYNQVVQRLRQSRWFEDLVVTHIDNQKVIAQIVLKGDGQQYFNHLLYHQPILRHIQPIESSNETRLLMDEEDQSTQAEESENPSNSMQNTADKNTSSGDDETIDTTSLYIGDTAHRNNPPKTRHYEYIQHRTQ